MQQLQEVLEATQQGAEQDLATVKEEVKGKVEEIRQLQAQLQEKEAEVTSANQRREEMEQNVQVKDPGAN